MGIHIGVVVDMLQEDSLPLAVVDTVDTVAAGVDNLLVEGTGVDSLNQQYNIIILDSLLMKVAIPPW